MITYYNIFVFIVTCYVLFRGFTYGLCLPFVGTILSYPFSVIFLYLVHPLAIPYMKE